MPASRPSSELKPRKSPRQHRSRATVDAILAAAAQVFTRHGYAAGTTNRIAARAGVSIGSLYEYFPNKDALLVALLEQHIGEGEAVLGEAVVKVASAQLDLPDAVHALVTAMVELHGQDPQLHRVLFEEAPLPRRVRQMLFATEDRVTELLQTYLAAQPQFARRDVALAARIAVQTVEALTHRLVVHDANRANHAAQIDEISTLIVAYLTKAPAP